MKLTTASTTVKSASTIIDDNSPVASINATDTVASETGPDNGSYAISLDRNTGLSEEIAYALSGNASNGADYNLTAGPATGSETQTSNADFNAGSNSSTQVFGGSVKLQPSAYSYPSVIDTTTVDAEQLLIYRSIL